MKRSSQFSNETQATWMNIWNPNHKTTWDHNMGHFKLAKKINTDVIFFKIQFIIILKTTNER